MPRLRDVTNAPHLAQAILIKSHRENSRLSGDKLAADLGVQSPHWTIGARECSDADSRLAIAPIVQKQLPLMISLPGKRMWGIASE